MNRRLVAALGVALGVAGLAAVAVPELTAVLPANDALLLVLGALLVLGGLRDVWRRRQTDPTYAEPSDTEQPVDLPAPGQEFDRKLGRLSNLLYRGRMRNRVRETVTTVARETLQRRCGYTADEASEALQEGAWTDDPFAAAFFAGEPPAISPLSKVREFITPGSSFQHRAGRAIDELYRLAEEEDPDGEE